MYPTNLRCVRAEGRITALPLTRRTLLISAIVTDARNASVADACGSTPTPVLLSVNTNGTANAGSVYSHVSSMVRIGSPPVIEADANGESDLKEAGRTAVINKRAGGTGLISGRKAFQRPMAESVGILNAIQDVYLSKKVTIA